MIKFEVGKWYFETDYMRYKYKIISRVHNPKDNADYVVVIDNTEYERLCKLCRVLKKNDIEFINLGNDRTYFNTCSAKYSVDVTQEEEEKIYNDAHEFEKKCSKAVACS